MLEGHSLHFQNRPDIFKGSSKEVNAYVKSFLENNLAYKYVYEIESKIVGLIFTSIKYNPGDDLLKLRKIAFIENIVVGQNYQRMGIGTKLYNKLCMEVKRENVDTIELCVWGF